MITIEKQYLIPQGILTEIAQMRQFGEETVGLTIDSDEANQRAATALARLKKVRNTIDEKRKELNKPMEAEVAERNLAFRDELAPIGKAIDVIGKAMIAYETEKQRKAAEAQRIAQAEIDAKKRAAEEAAQKELEKAKQYAEQGRTDMAEKAEARADAKLEVASSIVAPTYEVPKTRGASFTTEWKASITNVTECARHCLQNPILENLVLIDKSGLEKVKNKTAPKLEVPGVTWEKTMRIASRTR